MGKGRLLIVEDDIDISQMLVTLLSDTGYDTHVAYSGTEAVMLLEKGSYDLILLDLMLPGLSGEAVLERIRKQFHVPVIAVSAKDNKSTKLDVMRNGADDFISKPFDNDELLVRIEVVLRRYNSNLDTSQNWLTYKDLRLNRSTYEAQLNGQYVELTKKEYKILELLMSNPNKVYTKNNIFESVWNETFLGEDNAVNVHISNIRNKLAKINPEERYIKTVWGIGFKME